MSTKTIKIDVISDFACAWCYIGHLELEHGMALARSRGLPVQFAVQYHPFILNCRLSDDQAISKEDFFIRKFGSMDKANEFLKLVRIRGKEEGLNLSFSGNMRQTTRAHRLLQKAYLDRGASAQCGLLRRLFRAFFEEERDIGDTQILARLASSDTYPFPPLDKPESDTDLPEITVTKTEFDVHADDGSAKIFESEKQALTWLEGSELEKEVRTMSADAARKGVAGVPFTVIDGRWAVSGCQKPECYYKIFEKLATSDMSLPTMNKSEGIQKICNVGNSCPATV